MEELLYAMRRDQEGRQRQGLRTDDGAPAIQSRSRSQPFPYVYMFGTMKEALRGGSFSSDEEVIGTVQNWLKTHPKEKKNSDGIKKFDTLEPVR